MTSAATSADAQNDAGRLSTARIVIARSLTVLGLVLALLSLMAVYVRYELLDRSTFRGTSSELLQSEAIRDQIAATAVENLYANVDVATEIETRLPPAQQGLAVPISVAFRALAEQVADQLLARPAVQRRLVDSLDLSHEQILRLLRNKGRFTRVEGGVVFVDLRQLVEDLAERLGLPSSAAQKIPASASRIRLIESGELDNAQRAVRMLDFMAAWLWVFVLVSWAIALYLVPGRRRVELRAIAVGFVGVGLLVLLVRRMGGTYVVDDLVTTASVKPAASDAYGIVTRNLQDAGRTDVAVGLVALTGVWLAGPRERARLALRWLAPYLARPALVYGLYALVWVLLLAWRPTVQFSRPRYVLLMLVLGAAGLETLRRLAQRRYPHVEPTSFGVSVANWWASFRSSRESLVAGRDSSSRKPASPTTEQPSRTILDAQSAAGATTEAAQLATLAALYDAGKLTDEEFALAKQRVLG